MEELKKITKDMLDGISDDKALYVINQLVQKYWLEESSIEMSGIADGFNPDKKPKKREKSIESYLKEQVEKLGGKCYKFESPGTAGMPDRIVVYKGCVVFIETKRPGAKPRKLQQERIKELIAQHVPAFSIDTKDKVDNLIMRLSIDGNRYHG
jgi:hypothetical protein